VIIKNSINNISVQIQNNAKDLKLSFSKDELDEINNPNFNRRNSSSKNKDNSTQNSKGGLYNYTPQFSDKKLIPTVEERKQRINALQNYMESYLEEETGLSTQQAAKNEEPIIVKDVKRVNNSAGSSGKENVSSGTAQSLISSVQTSQTSVNNNGNQNFRKKIFLSSKETNPKLVTEGMTTNSSKSTDHRRTEGDNSGLQTRSFMDELSFFNEDCDLDGNVEEMHYFFVAFHQKSKQYLSRMERKGEN